VSQYVIKCLDQLFALCGMPNYVHSDLGRSFISQELKDYFLRRGVASSHSTPYHPTGNAQVERYNGALWQAVRLCLKPYQLPVESWESVFPDGLHASRSLLCTATNAMPHELFFGLHRSPSEKTLPSWLLRSGPVFLRKHARSGKHDDVVEGVELLHANPMYANVRHKDGREQNVSLCDIAPCPRTQTLNSPDPVVDVPVPEVAIDSPALSNEHQQNSGPTSQSP